MEVSALSFSHVPANLAWVPLSEDVGARLWSLGLAKGSLRDPSDGSEVVCVNVLWKGDGGSGRPAPKYIKRVAKPGGGYRYYYAAHAGGGVHNTAHFTEGSSFAHGGGHFHVKAVGPDGMLHVEHSQAPGQRVQMTHAELAAKLHEHHAPALESHRKGVLERFMRDIGEAAGKRKESLEKKAAKYGYEKPAAKKEAGAQSKPVLPGKTTSKPYSGGKEYNLGQIGTLDPEKAAKSKAEGKAQLKARESAGESKKTSGPDDYDFSGGAPDGGQALKPEAKSAKTEPAKSKIPESRVEHEIPSTNIKRVSWDPEKPGSPKGKMRVHFDNGGVYDYEGVHHDDYRKVIDAHGSHGKAFNDHVKGLHKTTKVRDADGGTLGKEAAARQRDTRQAEATASRQASAGNYEARQKRAEDQKKAIRERYDNAMKRGDNNLAMAYARQLAERHGDKIALADYNKKTDISAAQKVFDESLSEVNFGNRNVPTTHAKTAIDQLKAAGVDTKEHDAKLTQALKSTSTDTGPTANETRAKKAGDLLTRIESMPLMERARLERHLGFDPTVGKDTGDDVEAHKLLDSKAAHGRMTDVERAQQDALISRVQGALDAGAHKAPSKAPTPPAKTEPPALRPAEPTRPGPKTDHYAQAQSVYGLSDKHIQAIKAKSQTRAKQATARGDHEGAAKIVREAVRDHVQRSTTHTPEKIAQWMKERESKHVGKSLLWFLASAAKSGAPHA